MIARPLVACGALACGGPDGAKSSGCADLGCLDGLLFVVEMTPPPDGAALAIELTVGEKTHACAAVAAGDLVAGCGDFWLLQVSHGYELHGQGDHREPVDVHLVLRVDGEVVVDEAVDTTWTNDTGFTRIACRTCWAVEGTVVVP